MRRHVAGQEGPVAQSLCAVARIWPQWNTFERDQGRVYAATRLDFDIPARYGLRQTIGDTLGIGGIFRGLRTIPVAVSLAEDMLRHCPDTLRSCPLRFAADPAA